MMTSMISTGYLKANTNISEGGSLFISFYSIIMDLFTVMCLATRPLNESKAKVDLVVIQTSLLLLCE